MIILIKAVIFDIGGVVIRNAMPYVYKSIGRNFGLDWKRVKIEDEKNDPLSETNKISSDQLYVRLSNGLSISDVEAFKREWSRSFRRNAVLNKNVAKLIEHIKNKGYHVATLSNTISPHEKLHRRLGHYKFFHKVFLSNRLRMRKPAVKVYLYVAKKLNAKPSECIFIDDKLRNVIGARKAGMNSILFRNASQLRQGLKRYL